MKTNILFFLIISVHLLHFSSAKTTDKSKCPLQCDCSNQARIICQNFDSFTQLNFSELRYAQIEYLRLEPKTKLILNDSLDFNGLIFTRNLKVELKNLGGFVITDNPFQRATIKYAEIKILNSDLTFLANNVQLSLTDCETLISSNSFRANIFSSFNSIVLGENLKYPKQLCPVVFKNLKINSLKMYSLNEYENKLDFEFVNNPFQLNTIINELFIHESNVALNELLVYFGLFKDLKSIIVTNTNLISISANLFKPYRNLKLIYFELPNLSRFFERNNFNWMANLPANNLRLVFKINNEFEYDFYEEDFCRFKYFPGEQNVFIEFRFEKLENNSKLPCTCTLMSLVRNYHRDVSSIYVNNLESYFKCGRELDNRIKDCDLNQKLENCQNPISNSVLTTAKSTTNDALIIKTHSSVLLSTFSFIFVLIIKFFY